MGHWGNGALGRWGKSRNAPTPQYLATLRNTRGFNGNVDFCISFRTANETFLRENYPILSKCEKWIFHFTLKSQRRYLKVPNYD